MQDGKSFPALSLYFLRICEKKRRICRILLPYPSLTGCVCGGEREGGFLLAKCAGMCYNI